MKRKLSVSMMCSDLLNLSTVIQSLETLKVDYLHIDIMDAMFVPNLTFGPDMVNSIRKMSDMPLDIHLLMNYPLVIVRSLNIKEGDIVTIHSECKESIMENAAFVKQKGGLFGLALNPDTIVEEVAKYLPFVDVILLMMIVPGFAGTTMIHGIMNKVSQTKDFLLKHGYNNIQLCVDGSVSCDKANYMAKLGASIFVGGTAGIFIKGRQIENTIPEFYENINYEESNL